MNFLAHLYLSGNDEEIMIGNFIADSVKGKAYLKYRPKVRQGILLHRRIDEFTDKHQITKYLSGLLKSGYSRYSGIVVDIFYDHFLCANWSNYSSIALEKYICQCHRVILRHLWLLPSSVKGFLPFLIARKRLLSYSTIEGVENALKTMSKYTSLPAASEFATSVLKTNYAQFDKSFSDFFGDLVQYTEKELKNVSEVL